MRNNLIQFHIRSQYKRIITAIQYSLSELNKLSDNNMEKQEPRKKLIVVAISDTHASLNKLNQISKMEGDIFIHGGDFTRYGSEINFLNFFKFLSSLKFRYKIVVAGNHEISLDTVMSLKSKNKYLAKYPCSLTREEILNQLKKHCIYLQHQSIQIQGVKIFGSPYTPTYGGSAFQYQKQHQRIIWQQIPYGLDILLTHGPPFGILDKTTKGDNAGSVELSKISKERHPKYHIFGHIHEARGMYKTQNTFYINMANDVIKLLI